jgi:hypothetical protein
LIERELREILGDDKPTIAAGDFNAKHVDWFCRTTNPNGRILQNFAANNEVVIEDPPQPTYYDYCLDDRPDILDIALAKNVTHQIRLTVINELDSDHIPVLMHIGNEANDPDLICYGKTDWSKLTEHNAATLGNIPRIHTEEDLERAVEWLENGIKTSIDAVTKRFSEPRTRFTVPQHIVELIRAKIRGRKVARRTGFPMDRTTANRLQFEVKQALSDFRNEQWERKLDSLNVEDNSIWKMVKLLRNNRKPLPPIHGAHGMVYTDEEKAEAFADSLELQCRANFANADLDHVEKVEEQAEQIADEAGCGTFQLAGKPPTSSSFRNQERTRSSRKIIVQSAYCHQLVR